MRDRHQINGDAGDDRELWTAVRDVPVPPAGEEFMPALMARVEKECGREQTAVLAHAAKRPGRRTGWRSTRFRVALALVGASAAVALVALVGLPGVRSGGPDTATAAEVLARMQTALSSARTLREELTYTTHDVSEGSPALQKFTFLVTAAGDIRLETSATQDGETLMRFVNVYNAAKNAMRGAVGGYNMWTGVGTPPMCFINHAMSEYQAMVMAALAEGDSSAAIRSAVYQGSPAWEVSFSSLKGATLDEDQWAYRAVVDKDSGLMVALDGRAPQERSGGSMSEFEMRVTEYGVDEPLPPDAFAVRLEPRGYDGRCSLAEVEGRVGYRPFVPAEVPQGYELMHAATDPLAVYSRPEAGDEPVGVATSFGDGEPAYDDWPLEDFPPDNEVGLLYARGLDRFWIQLAPLTGAWRLDARSFLDNVASYGRDVRTISLEGGAFSGRLATTWFDAEGVNVFVADDAHAVRVSGYLTREEALAVADSLEVFGE